MVHLIITNHASTLQATMIDNGIDIWPCLKLSLPISKSWQWCYNQERPLDPSSLQTAHPEWSQCVKLTAMPSTCTTVRKAIVWIVFPKPISSAKIQFWLNRKSDQQLNTSTYHSLLTNCTSWTATNWDLPAGSLAVCYRYWILVIHPCVSTTEDTALLWTITYMARQCQNEKMFDWCLTPCCDWGGTSRSL